MAQPEHLQNTRYAASVRDGISKAASRVKGRMNCGKTVGMLETFDETRDETERMRREGPKSHAICIPISNKFGALEIMGRGCIKRYDVECHPGRSVQCSPGVDAMEACVDHSEVKLGHIVLALFLEEHEDGISYAASSFLHKAGSFLTETRRSGDAVSPCRRR